MEKCKFCGAELKPGIKFCTKCGTPVGADKPTRSSQTNHSNSARATQANTNETIDKIKNHSLNYFSWYKNAIMNPSIVDDSNKYNGLITLLLNVILVAYSFYIVFNRVFLAVKTGANQTMEYFGSSMKLDIPTGFSLFMRLFLIVLAYYGVFLLIGFFCKKMMINKDEDIFKYSNQLGSFSSSLIALQLLMAVFLLVSIPKDLTAVSSFSVLDSFEFVIVLVAILSAIWSVAYIASMILDEGKARFDKIYVAVITLLLNNVMLYFLFKMFLNSTVNKYSDIIKGFIR